MTAKFRSWWEKIRKPLGIIGIIAACIGVVVLVFVVIRLYGTGFVGKNLWEWLGLLATLAIPVVVGFGAAWFTAQQGKVSDRENKDNQREVALQAYIDKMSELLLKWHLGEPDGKSKPGYEQALNIARVRTITILFQLDARRMSYVFAFLREARLVSVVRLDGADFRTVNWGQANLIEANLSGASLSGANLSRADLTKANLIEANFSGANLSRANLRGADLTKINLSGANLSRADLREADLRKANLRKADLRKADLRKADLREADLDQAKLCDLSGDYLAEDGKVRATREAKLRGAILDSTKLKDAISKGIIISRAQLKKAKTPPSLAE